MEHKQGVLPPYAVASRPLPGRWQGTPGRRRIRRSRGLRAFALACLAFIVYAQWRQMSSSPLVRNSSSSMLSTKQLQEDWATCGKLRHKPEDPIGLGRKRSDRWVEGQKPTLIRNATIWVGEPAEEASVHDIKAGKGYTWVQGDVLLEYGLITKVKADISVASLPKDTQIYDAKGRPLTSGIIDMHSHAGVDSLPDLRGNDDTNEMSNPITPYVRSIDAIQPLDPQIQVIKSGGVTTSLILPGSGNNIGGEAYLIKHAVGPKDGRPELSVTDMLADHNRTWRYMKMACGENAKRVFGKVGERGPVSRQGESWEFRHAFEQAATLVRAQDDWCAGAGALGAEKMQSYLPRELKWESLGAVLRGQVHVNTHCYTVPDLEAFVDHTNEFHFPIRAFHHAHSTFLVPEILKRAYGGPPASALFADNMYYKAEAYVGSEYAGKILWENGLTPVYVSDNPVLNAQHVVFEAAKAFHYGLPYPVALSAVTTAPAERLGMGNRLGKIKPGFDADVVVWDSDPLSVGAAPVQVWIDGTHQFKDPFELNKPDSKPFVTDAGLKKTPGEPVKVDDVVFTGVTKDLLTGYDEQGSRDQSFAVAISNGKISCIGECKEELSAAAATGKRVESLKNGYLTDSFTAFGSYLGLREIDAEKDTANGVGDVFSRGVDGLALDTKKLGVAYDYGVTKAITSPARSGDQTHYGTSVEFLTGATNKVAKGTVLTNDVAVHYALGLGAKYGKAPTISSAVGAIRHLLLEAVESNETISDPYSEKAYLKKVIKGEVPLAISVHSADTIATLLEVKKTVEDEIAARSADSKPSKLRLLIIGGAEAYLVADELAAANVGVVLAPLQSYGTKWEERRALSGAPLTNGTSIDILLDAGVVTAIGLEEDWLIRDMGLLAGIAYSNGGGRLTEKGALDLVSTNIYKMLGKEAQKKGNEAHFVVFEGSPLEIGSRIKAVGGGLGYVSLTE